MNRSVEPIGAFSINSGPHPVYRVETARSSSL